MRVWGEGRLQRLSGTTNSNLRIGFSNFPEKCFYSIFFEKQRLFKKIIVFYKVSPKAIAAEESKSGVSSSKCLADFVKIDVTGFPTDAK